MIQYMSFDWFVDNSIAQQYCYFLHKCGNVETEAPLLSYLSNIAKIEIFNENMTKGI